MRALIFVAVAGITWIAHGSLYPPQLSPPTSNSASLANWVLLGDIPVPGDATVRIYSVDGVSVPPYDAGHLLLARISHPHFARLGKVVREEESVSWQRYVFLDGKLVFLPRISQTEREADRILNYFRILGYSTAIDSISFIPTLTYPDEIAVPGTDDRLFLIEEHPVDDLEPSDGVLFEHAALGQVLFTGEPRDAFVVIRPDGTALIYDDRFSETIDPTVIDWEIDHPAQTVPYRKGLPELIHYPEARPYPFDAVLQPEEFDIERDLIAAGHRTDRGDPVYLLRDPEHPALRELFEKHKKETPYEELSVAEFLAVHPILFWQGPFGRFHRFDNMAVHFWSIAEPIIYLYPPMPMEVSLTVRAPVRVTQTRPAYDGGWMVHADPSGSLRLLSGTRHYGSLFWEGLVPPLLSPKTGFVVAQAEVRGFLETTLPRLGLVREEATDFVDAWAPRMTGAPYFFVTFYSQDEIERIAPLEIDPYPDTVIRVLMDFWPLQSPHKVDPPGFPAVPPRRGFTLVEWGGIAR